MGVEHVVYSVIGISVEKDEEIKYVRSVIDSYEEDFFDKMDTPLKVIIDGMCGKYVVIGEILSSHDKYGDGELVEVGMGFLQGTFAAVEDDIRLFFPGLEKVNVCLLTFSHFF